MIPNLLLIACSARRQLQQVMPSPSENLTARHTGDEIRDLAQFNLWGCKVAADPASKRGSFLANHDASVENKRASFSVNR